MPEEKAKISALYRKGKIVLILHDEDGCVFHTAEATESVLCAAAAFVENLDPDKQVKINMKDRSVYLRVEPSQSTPESSGPKLKLIKGGAQT